MLLVTCVYEQLSEFILLKCAGGYPMMYWGMALAPQEGGTHPRGGQTKKERTNSQEGSHVVITDFEKIIENLFIFCTCNTTSAKENGHCPSCGNIYSLHWV